jgi:steroid delta-isomerase-like uncharacterized protein
LRSTGETTGGAFALLEHWEMPVGFGTPYHTHHREDESFYVLEGQLAIICDGKWLKAGPGTFVFGPREIPHGFQVVGDSPAKMLLVCSPAGFERFVLEQTSPISEPPRPPDMARLMTLAEKYAIEIHGPLPEIPAELLARAANDDLRALNDRWVRALNSRDWEAERAVRSAGFRAHLSGLKEPLDSAGWTAFLTELHTAFPDCKTTVHSTVAEGNRLAAQWTFTGTHLGVFNGIAPTGKAVQFSGTEYDTIEDGKVVEHTCMFDNLALLRQIGAISD